jgi:hypothetical protein
MGKREEALNSEGGGAMMKADVLVSFEESGAESSYIPSRSRRLC